MSRPSETITAIAGSVIGAVLIIVGWVQEGPDVGNMPTEVVGALTLLVGWISAGVTWWVARRQRQGSLGSTGDGKVIPQ